MSIQDSFNLLWRRKWIILLVILVALVLVAPSVSSARNEYAGQVKLLVTLPEISTVDLYGAYRSSSVQDEVNLARNNFVDIVKSVEVRRRTTESLELSESLRQYDLEVDEPRDTEFLVITVKAPDRIWAAEIANAHVGEALGYFGEIRARPAAAARDALTEQLQEVRVRVFADEEALLAFEESNRISSLDAELQIQRQVLADLYLQKNRYTVEGAASGLSIAFREIIQTLESERTVAEESGRADQAGALDDVIERYADNMSDLLEQYKAETSVIFVASTDSLIALEEEKLARLNRLKPQYDNLEFQLSRSQARMQQLYDANLEAGSKEDTARKVNFIHVVLPATPPFQANTRSAAILLILTVVGSAGIGVALAFVIEYFNVESPAQEKLAQLLPKER
jgi:uncharacterized protein involved in exopolysaccharide biosynthesis